MAKKDNYKVGRHIEELVADYVKAKGYKVIERNFVSYVGEIDIIAVKKGIYHIIEVKYRHNLKFGYPREHVTPDKQNKIRRSAEYYFLKNKIVEPKVCFDVVEVIGTEDIKIELVENAF